MAQYERAELLPDGETRPIEPERRPAVRWLSWKYVPVSIPAPGTENPAGRVNPKRPAIRLEVLMEQVARKLEKVEARHALSLEDLYLRERPRLVAIAYALCGSWDVSEELAQETFLVAWRKRTDVITFDRPELWLRRVITNLAFSRLRRWYSEVRAVARLQARTSPTPTSMPDDAMAFWDCVRQLPPRQAQVVALYYGDDLSVKDIAVVLACAEGTVKAQLSKARTALARRLQLQTEEETE
jgi:RNA polymerase sigma-70 factor, ECF subfamily